MKANFLGLITSLAVGISWKHTLEAATFGKTSISTHQRPLYLHSVQTLRVPDHCAKNRDVIINKQAHHFSMELTLNIYNYIERGVFLLVRLGVSHF